MRSVLEFFFFKSRTLHFIAAIHVCKNRLNASKSANHDAGCDPLPASRILNDNNKRGDFYNISNIVPRTSPMTPAQKPSERSWERGCNISRTITWQLTSKEQQWSSIRTLVARFGSSRTISLLFHEGHFKQTKKRKEKNS